MKRLLTLFAVLAFTAPVFAGDPNVLITITDEGGGLVAVNYQLLDEDGSNPGLANLMRGIAMEITTSNTALFDAISDYATGSTPADSENIPAGYSIFPGSLQFATDPNFVSDFGDPVAPSGAPDAGDDLPDAAVIVVELGSLYADGDPAPGTSGTLFKLQLDANSEGSTDLGFAAETTRGGVVMEDGSPGGIALDGTPGAYTVLFDCMAPTNPQYNDWVDWDLNGPDPGDKPDCWCYQKQCHGDTDGAMFGPFPVAANDFTTLKGAISKPAAMIPPGGICADLNHDAFGPFRVAADDFAELKRWISKPNLAVPVCSGPGCVGFQGSGASPGPCDSNPLPNTEYIFWKN